MHLFFALLILRTNLKQLVYQNVEIYIDIRESNQKKARHRPKLRVLNCFKRN